MHAADCQLKMNSQITNDLYVSTLTELLRRKNINDAYHSNKAAYANLPRDDLSLSNQVEK